MKKVHVLSMVLLAFALLLGGCGSDSSSNLDKLNGTWVISMEDTINANKQLKDSIPSGEAGDMARNMINEMFSSITMTFDTKNKTTSGKIMNQDIPTTPFEVVSEKDNVIEIKADGNVTKLVIKGETLEIQADPTTVLVLKRK